MRILHISPFFHPSIGGIETFCKELSINTARLGHEVHVITFTKAEPNDENLDEIVIHRLKPLLSWFKARFSPKVRNLIKEIHPDIIHIQAPAPITQEFSFVKGYKYLATYHNDPVLTNRLDYKLVVWLYKQFLYPRFYKEVDRVICPSTSIQQTSNFLKSIPIGKKGVIPNGVDVSVFTPTNENKVYLRRKLGLTSEKIGIFVGSMEKWHAYKGINVLLTALSKIDEVDITFIFIGDGELRPRYEEKAHKLIEMNVVTFLGKVNNKTLIECYQASDFFVLPSIGVECAPIVLLEAMACGLPIITTNIPGPSDIVKEGINGLTVKPNKPEEICEAIKKLVTDEDKLRRMSINARKFAVEKYDWEKIVEAYIKEYKNLLNDRL
ncbi:MAG: glycosyltransferase family 4 protein [Candidatus Hodarchaeota archaeon]